MSPKVQVLKSVAVTVVCLQQICAYRVGAPSLLQDDFNKYINFNNFDKINRQRRQVSGFLWDSPSQNFDNDFNNRRNFNGINWNSPTDDLSDSFVFEDDFENRNFVPRTTQRPITRHRPTTQRVPVSTVEIPGMGTPRTPCENRCLVTPEYNPVCGDDDMTYFSRHRLSCAQRCGKRVNLKHLGACSRFPPRG